MMSLLSLFMCFVVTAIGIAVAVEKDTEMAYSRQELPFWYPMVYNYECKYKQGRHARRIANPTYYQLCVGSK